MLVLSTTITPMVTPLVGGFTPGVQDGRGGRTATAESWIETAINRLAILISQEMRRAPREVDTSTGGQVGSSGQRRSMRNPVGATSPVQLRSASSAWEEGDDSDECRMTEVMHALRSLTEEGDHQERKEEEACRDSGEEQLNGPWLSQKCACSGTEGDDALPILQQGAGSEQLLNSKKVRREEVGGEGQEPTRRKRPRRAATGWQSNTGKQGGASCFD